MDNRFNHYWMTPWPQTHLRRTLIASVALHVVLGVAVGQLYLKQTELPPQMVYQVQFFSPPTPEPPKEVIAKAVPPETKPKPIPDPPKEVEKKPPPKKPAPPKVVKKVEPEPVKKPKPPEPKPPEPKPPEPKKPPPKHEQIAKAEPLVQAPSVSEAQALPPELQSWGRRVQRKVEGLWAAPAGVRMNTDKKEAKVEFWVDRRGRLIEGPTVIQHAADRVLGESGARAIRLAAPLPPLPETFSESRQRVVYSFTVAR